MKKKGLIISTIVMVVVLIASLTTATYAWFTASSEVKIDAINLSIKSDAAVNVGVKTESSGTGYDLYRYETLTSTSTGNTVAWDTSSATPGLGSTLAFSNLDLGVNKAIGTGVLSTPTVDADAFDLASLIAGTKGLVKAAAGDGVKDGSGNYTTQPDRTAKEVSEAVANKDFLHVTIGAEANKANIAGMYVKVVVQTTDGKSTLGMNAALHFIIKMPDGKKLDFEPFGNYTYKTVKNSTTASTQPTNGGKVTYADNQLTSTFYFWIATTNAEGGFGLNGTDIHDVELYAFISGADTDCNSQAVGSACTISISFDGTEYATKLSKAESEAAITTVTFVTPA